MRKLYIKSLLLLTFLAVMPLVSNAQSTKFQRLIGGAGEDLSYGMAQTADGGYILTGSTKSYGSGGSDVYLIKTDGLGKVLWSKAYGTKNDEVGWKVRQAADSGYIIGGTINTNNGDGLLMKTDASGVIQWSLTLNSDSTEDIYNVLESRFNGDIYITGMVKSDSLSYDAFLAKYTKAGKFIWQRRIGSAGIEEGYAMVEDLKGNIAVTGMIQNDTITIGGKLGMPGDVDFFIANFDSRGNRRWIKNYGSDNVDQAWDIKLHGGNYVVVGWTNIGPGISDVLVCLIDTTGKRVSSYSYTIESSSRAFSVVVNPDDTYSITGYTDHDITGRESFYMNISKAGVVRSLKTMGGSGKDGHWPSQVTRTSDGGYTVFTTSNSFGSSSGDDLYLIRMDENGVTDCNQNTPINNNLGFNLSDDFFGQVKGGTVFSSISLTTTNISNISDSVLCCKLQAQTAGYTVRVCNNGEARIGKPAIFGYKYKWTQIGGSFTSTEASPLIKPKGNESYKLVVTSSDGKCASDSAIVNMGVRADLADKEFISDTFFCAGKTIEVSARSGMIDYSWKGTKANYSGRILNFNTADTLVLTVTDTTTCTYNDTMIITMKSLPVFSLGNDTTICDNTKITLSGPANMDSYLWNGGEATSRTFTTSEEKTHTLSVVDQFGCAYSDSRVIFNNPSSTFSLGRDTSICEGIDYTIIGPGFLTNYFWNGVSSFSANKVTKTPGTYILEASNSFGCKHSDTIVLNKKPDPVFSLGPDRGVCASGGSVLTGPSGVASYHWNDASTDSTLDVFFAGTYWLRVTGNNGCIYTDSITMAIVANPVPELGADTTICEQDSIYLDAGNYISFSWNNGEKTRIIKVKTAGLYEVTVTDANGCNGIDDKSIKTKFCVDNIVKKAVIPGLSVYPNPAKDQLNISWLVKYKNANFSIYDINGKRVYSNENEPGLNDYSIDVSNFSRGMYLIKVTADDMQQSLKVMLD